MSEPRPGAYGGSFKQKDDRLIYEESQDQQRQGEPQIVEMIDGPDQSQSFRQNQRMRSLKKN